MRCEEQATEEIENDEVSKTFVAALFSIFMPLFIIYLLLRVRGVKNDAAQIF